MMVVEPDFFPSDAGLLYGVLHEPRDLSGRGLAALLCPPASFEYTATHRALRVLAARLGGLGIPTLRFDWSGTGDSTGRESDERPHLDEWRGDVRCAMDRLVTKTKAKGVVLVGVRLGGSVAFMEMSGDPRVPGMALWSPVIRAEEQTTHVQAAVRRARARLGHEDQLEPALPAPEGLSGLDLLNGPESFSGRMLLVGDGASAIHLFAERIRAGGAHVHERSTADSDAWRRHEDVEQLVPPETLRVIVEWVKDL